MSTHNKNTHTVKLADGREVLYSYTTAVAAFVPGRGYVALDRYFSATTSRHVNEYTERRAVRIPQAEFNELIAPLEAVS